MLDIFNIQDEYISASLASKKSGYSGDYIGQLCRRKKIPGKLVGRTWYVDYAALIAYKKNKTNGKSIPVISLEESESSPATLGENSSDREKEISFLSVIHDPAPLLPEVTKSRKYVPPIITPKLFSEMSFVSLALIFTLVSGFATLEKTSPATLVALHDKAGKISELPKDFAELLTPKMYLSQVAAVSLLDFLQSSVDSLFARFSNLRNFALGEPENNIQAIPLEPTGSQENPVSNGASI